MARENRTGGFCVPAPQRLLPGIQGKINGKNRRNRRRAAIPVAAFVGLEALESRLLLTVTPTLAAGVLTCTGTEGQANTIDVALANNGASIVATVDGVSLTSSTSSVKSLVINAGTRSDSIKVDPGIGVDETLTEGNGAPPSPTSTGSSSTGGGSSTTGTGSSSTGSGSSSTGGGSSTTGTGSSSTGSGSSSTGTGSSSTGTGSSSTGSGSSSTGSGSSSTGTGSSSTGSGSSTTGTGSSSTGTGSSSTGSGSSTTGTGSSSTGTGSSSTGSGSSSTGSGSSSTGSGSSSTGTGSSSTGSGSSSTGSGSSSTGTGSSSDPTPIPTPSNPNDPATPTAVVTLTSPAAVYPLESVNVQAVDSNFGSGTVLNSTISWNFGDPGSEYNTLVGFNAAHAYANPGTYTITMSITTPDGHVGVATQTVTVAQDNRPTIYVSSNGNDANNGSSPNDPIASLARLQQLLTSGERVLFQAGDTFTFNSANAINLGGLQDVYVGSYGSGAQPVIFYDGPAVGGTVIGTSDSSSGIVVQGITFDSSFVNNDNQQAIPSAFILAGNDITLIGNTFLNLGDDINLVLAPSNVLIQDNTSPNPTALSGYFGWVAGSEINFLGNTVASSAGEAVMRVAGVTDLELAYNNFTNNPETAGGSVSKNTLSTQVGQYVYVYNNVFATGPVNAGPLGTDVANPNVTIQDVVFDSNVINNSTLLLTAGVQNVMIKNNVINSTGDSGITIDAQEIGGGFNWTVTNVWIEYNTVTEPGVYGGFLAINDGQAQGITMDYNLFVDPNFNISSGQAFVTVDENNMNSFSQILDNCWSQPAWVSPWVNGGMFFVSSDISSQTGWLTPAEWEASGIASGDMFQNVVLGGTYSATVNGILVGSNLPTA